MATRAPCSSSRSSNSRPATRGMPAVRKYPGLTQFMFDDAVPSAPSRRTELEVEHPATRPHLDADADTTPGTVRTAATRRRESGAYCSDTYPLVIGSKEAVTRCSLENPGSIRVKLMSVRPSRNAAKTTTTDSASWKTTSDCIPFVVTCPT